MGTYTGDRTDPSTDSSEEEHIEDPNQPDLEEFDDEPTATPDEDDDDSGGTQSPTTPPSGGGGAKAGGGGVVTDAPPDDVPDDADDDYPDQPEVDRPDDLDHPDPDDEHESEDEDEDEDEEDESITVTVRTDPLSAMSWGNEPVIKRVKENYGDQVEFQYRIATVREFDDTEAARADWESSMKQHDMPVDPSFWDDPPESTELLNRSLVAAMRQGVGGPFLRLLWRECIGGGWNLSKEDDLLELADRLGLDADQFAEDMEDADLDYDDSRDELPFISMQIRGYPKTIVGKAHYTDFQEQFLFAGLDEGEPQDLAGFVEEHGPVALAEVMEVKQWGHDEALRHLEETDGLVTIPVGGAEYWRAE